MVTKRNSTLIAYAFLLKLMGKQVLFRLAGTASSFGLATCFAPIIGFFANASGCIGFFAIRTALSFVITGALSCTLYIPTLAGSLVLSSRSKFISIGIPLLCIGTFLMHPIGYYSWPYTLYWLIPIGLSFISHRSIFFQSLASTFTTHAVGSTIFIYTHPTTAVFWYSLMPQVWLERLVYAMILTTSYYVVIKSIQYINQFHLEGRPCKNLLPSF